MSQSESCIFPTLSIVNKDETSKEEVKIDTPVINSNKNLEQGVSILTSSLLQMEGWYHIYSLLVYGKLTWGCRCHGIIFDT